MEIPRIFVFNYTRQKFYSAASNLLIQNLVR